MNHTAMNDVPAVPEFDPHPALRVDSMRWHACHTVLLRRVLPVMGLLLVVLLAGCTRTYVITMTSGTRVTARGKPKLQGAYYLYKDVKGKPAQVSAGRVREIAPASMAREEGSQFFK